MTRTASILAVVLAILVGLAPWAASASTLAPLMSLIGAVLLLAGAHGAFRHHVLLHTVLLVVSLAVLARFLPAFFREGRFWPDLAIILLSALVFGLGLLGRVMDGYGGNTKSQDGVAQ